jgi:hypothetical protein
MAYLEAAGWHFKALLQNNVECTEKINFNSWWVQTSYAIMLP